MIIGRIPLHGIPFHFHLKISLQLNRQPYPTITLMMTSNTEEEFLRQYNGKQVKEDRKKYGGEKGNFFNSPEEVI